MGMKIAIRRILLGLGLVLAAGPAEAQTVTLITRADMSPQEQAVFDKMSGERAQNYLVTRSYWRMCRAVNAGTLPAAQLPDEPDAYDEVYQSAEERADCKKAITAAIAEALDKLTPR